LRHVLIFLNVSGITAGINLEASVVNRSDDTPNETESALVMRSGTVESPALALPALTRPGTQEVRVQGLHYEIKVATDEQHPPKLEPLPLLDADQLRAAAPTSFICASCSLPLVHGARITRYDDLPSEHWEELVDAWMCHTDQKLNAQVARNAKGFWPQNGQALVGGSYILFDKSTTVSANLRLVERAKVSLDLFFLLWVLGAERWTSRRPALANLPTSGRLRSSDYRCFVCLSKPHEGFGCCWLLRRLSKLWGAAGNASG
jgi:ubiquitin-protein ligase E3 D